LSGRAGIGAGPVVEAGLYGACQRSAHLLLALEILVASDLIRTVAVSPTLDNVLVLGSSC